MDPTLDNGLWGGVGAALAALAAYLWSRVGKREADAPVTEQLLNRIGELETSLASERTRSELLEGQVDKLRRERQELATRITHLEGQVTQLTALVLSFHSNGERHDPS